VSKTDESSVDQSGGEVEGLLIPEPSSAVVDSPAKYRPPIIMISIQEGVVPVKQMSRRDGRFFAITHQYLLVEKPLILH
jgi:hypothetical protein